MKGVYIKYWVLVLGVLLMGCRSYETDEYKQEEAQALEQLIAEFTNLSYMLSANAYASEKPTLYIISRLENFVDIRPDSTETLIREDSAGRYRSVLLELSQNTIDERKAFRALTNGSMAVGELTTELKHDRLTTILISQEAFDLKIEYEGLAEGFEIDPSLFGYLYLTRIIFSRDFTEGHMSYAFYCGQGCFWQNNVQILKKQGKWIIGRHYSGGIA